MTKIFVGGLNWATSNAGLKVAFSQFGEVKDATVVVDRNTGRSRGFGFVSFATPEQAQKAVGMDMQSIDGRVVRVNMAKDAPQK